MTYLDNLLATVFSANVDDSEKEQHAWLRAEPGAALADPRHDREAGFEEHEVHPAHGRSPCRFVVEHIRTPLFGRGTVP